MSFLIPWLMATYSALDVEVHIVCSFITPGDDCSSKEETISGYGISIIDIPYIVTISIVVTDPS